MDQTWFLRAAEKNEEDKYKIIRILRKVNVILNVFRFFDYIQNTLTWDYYKKIGDQQAWFLEWLCVYKIQSNKVNT